MPLGGRGFRGFPFEEEEGGAWSELAARHPDIAARLRQQGHGAVPTPAPHPAHPTHPAHPGHPAHPAHPAASQQAFPRKRRPEHGEQQQDFGATFDGFDRFPFDNIPPEFRDHLPPQWNRQPHPQQPHPHQPHPHQQQAQQPHGPQKQTIATQTEPVPEPIPLPHIEHPSQAHTQQPVPQPIPLPHLPHGQRNTSESDSAPSQWSAAPPVDERAQRCVSAPPEPNMSQQHEHAPDSGNVRIIPIQIEGRDGPVHREGPIHRDAPIHRDGPMPRATSPAPPPPFEEPPFHHHPGFAPPPPFRSGFNPNPRPYTSQKAYPQQQYARGVSPQRSHSPMPPQHEEHGYVKIPVHHETKTEQRPQQRPPPQQQPFQQQQQQYQQQQQQKFQEQQRAQTPPPQPKPQPTPQNDPITQILAIQTDVLNLMTDVENFTGAKKDKGYVYLDEMLTRNLLKLDNIETEGKENIRAARKEAIRCIQKCIAVLEAKAEKATQAQAQDVDMNSQEMKPENGEVDMKASDDASGAPAEAKEGEGGVGAAPTVADTRPAETDAKPDNVEKEKKGKKTGKNVKKRDKSCKEAKDSMQVDGKADKAKSHAMEVDGAVSQ